MKSYLKFDIYLRRLFKALIIFILLPVLVLIYCQYWTFSEPIQWLMILSLVTYWLFLGGLYIGIREKILDLQESFERKLYK